MSTNSGTTQGVQGITESDIAQYLAHTPAFFERHAELLSSVQLTSPHGQRAVSLQERQMEMLRERIKGLEHKIVEMIRHGQENASLADRLHRCTRRILLTTEAAELPARTVASLMHEFMIPQAAIRLWGVAPPADGRGDAEPPSDDVKSFAASLSAPYCGVNAGFEASEWLAEPGAAKSMAMLPLRHGEQCFGLLVFGSPDPTRYAAEMGTEFLARIGEVVSAALARLRPVA